MQALAAADRTYVLETGGISLEGTGKELLNNPQVNLLITTTDEGVENECTDGPAA
jgi:ABC-type branched-subunit amino acid transport system ATPase component